MIVLRSTKGLGLPATSPDGTPLEGTFHATRCRSPARGTPAWRESVEHCEGVDGAAAQGPCDIAKTELFEAQFPGMDMCILCTDKSIPLALMSSPNTAAAPWYRST
jgi:hypothetical protein